MTQEDLANQIGVSAQAVSKWETGVSMPDILLLPVIADVFGITVDEIYTGKREERGAVRKHYSFSELPEMLYQELLETDSYAWEHENEEERKKWLAELKENFSEDKNCTHFSISDRGGAVYTSHDFSLIHKNFGTKESLEILNSTEALPVLEALLDERVRRMFLYLVTNQKKMFTAAAIARKTGMTEEECRETLAKLNAAELVYLKSVEVDEEEDLAVYAITADNTKTLCVCMILRLAVQIRKSEWFYGSRGAYLPVDKD
ncbi:MAG: helix-turn-helix transcriptional regulator, partial [Clostridia bacterium]|nr:helix-turn-helix transcriptional regulator [Clostridia bacterium]